jgi:hypothetical protein
VIPYEKRAEGKAARASFAWDKSDLLKDARAFDSWKAAVLHGKAKEREFCEKVQFMLSFL